MAKIYFWPIQTEEAASRRLLASIPFHKGGGGAHRWAAAGIEEEVGSVGCSGWLVGDGSMAKSHPHNRSHVSLCAKDMDGDPSGLPCTCIQEQSALGRGKGTSICRSKVFNLKKAPDKAGGKNKRWEQHWRKWMVLTNFSHDTQSFLVVWASSPHKDPHLVLLQRALVVLNCSNNALRKKQRTGELGSLALTLSSIISRTTRDAQSELAQHDLGRMVWGCQHLQIVTHLKSGCYVSEVSNAASNDQDFT